MSERDNVGAVMIVSQDGSGVWAVWRGQNGEARLEGGQLEI